MMKAYGLHKRKYNGWCGPHDQRCTCDAKLSRAYEEREAESDIQDQLLVGSELEALKVAEEARDYDIAMRMGIGAF